MKFKTRKESDSNQKLFNHSYLVKKTPQLITNSSSGLNTINPTWLLKVLTFEVIDSKPIEFISGGVYKTKY